MILTGDTQVVSGGMVNIRADVYSDAGFHASGSFYFVWTDNAIPPHTFEETTSKPQSKWNITYEKKVYPPGPYNIQVDVKKKNW